MHKLIQTISQYTTLEEEQIADLGISFSSVKFSKGEHIQDAGKKCSKLYFINSGAVRTYYLQDGRDITSWIYPQGSFITTWTAFFTGSSAFENIQTIADSELFYISKNKLEALYKKHSVLETFGRKMVEEQLTFLDALNHEFMFADAKQRYDILLDFFPDITRIANLGHIASILGINQVTLSRIRKMK